MLYGSISEMDSSDGIEDHFRSQKVLGVPQADSCQASVVIENQ